MDGTKVRFELIQNAEFESILFISRSCFLKQSDLSSHYSVCMLAWLLACLWTVYANYLQQVVHEIFLN